jgi:hypothetical protein
MPDWDAKAELHMLTQMQTEPRMSPMYLETDKLKTLIEHVMQKRTADRKLYSITVGEKVYDTAAIEALASQIENS